MVLDRKADDSLRPLNSVGLITLMLLGAVGCQNPPSTQDMLTSSAGPERMRAVVRLADQNRWSDIPTFIRFLKDEDVSVRWAAIEALSAQTDTDLGFRPSDNPETRAVAVERWDRWWQTEGHLGPKHRPSPSAS